VSSGKDIRTQFRFVKVSEVYHATSRDFWLFLFCRKLHALKNEHPCHSLFLCLNAKKGGMKAGTNKNYNYTIEKETRIK
jgi:hypothetical protein